MEGLFICLGELTVMPARVSSEVSSEQLSTTRVGDEVGIRQGALSWTITAFLVPL